MKDTKDLEFQIFACIVLQPEIIEKLDFEDKYFKYNKILHYLIDMYYKYQGLDSNILIQNSNNEFIDLILEFLNYEVYWKNVFGYYKQLKETWRNNNIDLVTNQFKVKQITYNEFTKKMFELTNEDFDDEELLKPNDIDNEIKVEREYTYIDELDYLLKGLEYGKLNLFSGITNHGKTTFMIQLSKNFIREHKKVFYFSGEQTANEFKNYLYVGMCQKDQLEFIRDEHNPRIYDTKPKNDVLKYFDNIYANDFVVYNNNIIQNDVDKMIKVMRKAFNQGVRIFFIDNFMQLDNSEKLEEQTRIVELFKRFAMKNNVIVCLVAHPRKTQFMKNRLTIFDIAGTQNIANKSTNICTIMRTDLLNESDTKEVENVLIKNNYDINKCDAVIEVLKTKGNACKMVGLKYNKEFKNYYEAPKVSQEDKLKYEKSKVKKRSNEYYD
jgi:KaiC/GvpD/RAD55 family RecA-like ATPase